MIAVKTNTDVARIQVGGRSAAVGGSGHPPGLRSRQRRSNRAHTVGRIALPLPGNGTDGVSTRALLTLRGQLLPATIGKLPAVSYGVTGATAGSYDWNEMMKSSLPLVFGFVLTFAFLLLLASFRSLVIAAKAVVLNLLSVAAAYGVVVAVFQFGWGTNILGFTSNGIGGALAAAVHVRHPVRAVDGLPRVHPQPYPGGA